MENKPIVVLGCGLAGMAAALGLIKAGHKVVVYERYPYVKAAGNILNLWPPPIKALEDMGVDIQGLGAYCKATFNNASGRKRVDVRLPRDMADRYQGGFLGLLRRDLFTRMLEAMPEGTVRCGYHVSSIRDQDDRVVLEFSNGEVVETPLLIGADGIDSMIRRHLWGPQEKRSHNQLVVGGFTFEHVESALPDEVKVHHDRTAQATYSPILSQGKRGFQWWTVEAWPEEKPLPSDIGQYCREVVRRFPQSMQDLAASTAEQDLLPWRIRDLEPIRQWSRGRITLCGDAAHAVSPYAGYGAGMGICDGYFLGKFFAGIDLADTDAVRAVLQRYDEKRIPHSTEQVEQAHISGLVFHHTPWYLQWLRDWFLDYTPILQWFLGDRNPARIIAQLDEMGQGIVEPEKSK